MATGRIENLIPTSERTMEERKELAIKAGKASGKARRKKKELKQLLELALSQPCSDGSGEDNWTQMCAAIVNKALSGDTKAFESIRDTIGQKPTEQQQVDMTAKIEVDYGED